MSTSRIRLYSTDIVPAKNFQVDDIKTYLNTLTPIYEDSAFQYTKPNLDLEVKVDLPQGYLNPQFSNENFEQLVVNNAFETDLDDWSLSHIVAETELGSVVITNTVTTGEHFLYQRINGLKKNHIFYVCADIVYNENCFPYLRVLNSVGNTIVDGVNKIGCLFDTSTNTFFDIRIGLRDERGNLSYTGREYQYVSCSSTCAYDLTEIFGAGDEPSLSEFETILTSDMLEIPNYCTILQTDVNSYPFTYNYFVLKAEWIAKHTIKYILSMDTINTFQGLYEFSDKTSIIRQMKDRFYYPAIADPDTSFNAFRKVDRVSEGVDCLKYVDSTELLNGIETYGSDYKWYIWYQTSDELSTDNLSNPISTYMCSDHDMKMYVPATDTKDVDIYKIGNGDKYIIYFDYANNNGGTVSIPFRHSKTEQISTKIIILGSTRLINGTTYWGKEHTGNTFTIYNASVRVEQYPFNKVSTIKFEDESGANYFEVTTSEIDSNVLTWTFKKSNSYYARTNSTVPLEEEYKVYLYTDAYGGETTIYSLANQSEARTNSKNMKLIELPYCPVPYSYNSNTKHWTFTNFNFDSSGRLKWTDSTKTFLNADVAYKEINMTHALLPLGSYRANMLKNILYESKLYHSDIYNTRLSYDSFYTDIKFENMSPTTSDTSTTSLGVGFKLTNTINSRFIFKLNLFNTYYDVNDPYELYMNVNRNNEMSLYNNDYINYIRTGYNYDKKKNTLEEQANWLNTGLNIAGAVGSLAVGAATGNVISAAAGVSMTVSTVKSIASNLQSATANDNAMANKLHTLKQQASTVSGSDDIDLFDFYNEGNKLRVTTYEPNETVKEALYDLFFYTGYSCPKQAVPALDSRYRFDYVLCNPVFTSDSTKVYNVYVDDIKARYNAGVTILHNVDGYWDFEQKYENWEKWLIPDAANSTVLEALKAERTN